MPTANGLNVLVVDDRPDDASACCQLLTRGGHHVRVVYDGESALKEVIEDPPEVMLLDLELPKLDGFEVASATRDVKWVRRPLIVAVTAHGEDDYRRRAAEAGFDLYMLKPVDVDALGSLLRRYQATGRVRP
jgi:DNA-binding response OmpR family regulator